VSDEKLNDGYQPLHEGYQPREEKGYQPKEPQGSQQVIPPQSGTGEVKPTSDKTSSDKG
jgi:hypothetical protein